MSLKVQAENDHLARYDVFKRGEEPEWLKEALAELDKKNAEEEITTIKARLAAGVTDREQRAIQARLTALYMKLDRLR